MQTITSMPLGAWFVSGLLASLGIGLGGMVHDLSLGFFDLSFSERHGPFNIALLVVFACALIPPLVVHHGIKLPRKPLLAPHYSFETSAAIDRDLVVGAALFGVGWAVGGFCPGPSIVGLVTGLPNYVATTVGMLFGMLLHHMWRTKVDSPEAWLASCATVLLPVPFFVIGPALLRLDDVARVHTWPLLWSALGGLLIGAASILLLLLTGHIMGISGILASALTPKPASQKLSNLAFVFGMLFGGVVLYATVPQALSSPTHGSTLSVATMTAGGIVSGIGVSLAKGCTSGHGVGGLPRLAPRSLVAVPIFMLTTALTVTSLSLFQARLVSVQ